jgi:AcrR family transcriptional regulator
VARPREPEIDRRLHAAWAELSAERPYAEITMEAIAERAGVGKPSLYRRYPSKAHLAFATDVARSTAAPIDDRGDLEAELLDVYRGLAATLLATPREASADQIARAIADPDFARALEDEQTDPAVAAVMAVWERAVARGDVDPGIDGRRALNDLAAAVVVDVLVRHRPVDDEHLAEMVRRFVRGVRPEA